MERFRFSDESIHEDLDAFAVASWKFETCQIVASLPHDDFDILTQKAGEEAVGVDIIDEHKRECLSENLGIAVHYFTSRFYKANER